MVKYTPAFKDRVLREYCVGNRDSSFRALARRFKIKGGMSVIQRWYRRWKGTPLSLGRKKGSGGKRVLTSNEVQRYILRPIERKNKKHQAVHYPELKEPLERAVGHSVSLRTIQRRGKEEASIHGQSTIARTDLERTSYKHICHCLPVVLG